MARKRRRSGYQAISFTGGFSLSTLVDDVVLSTGILTFGEDFYCFSADLNFGLDENDELEGPITVGLAHGDLSVVEVAEADDASLTDPDDIIQRERARRPVRRVGKFSGATARENLNHGVNIRRKIGFSVGDGHSMIAWARNRSGVNLTGSMRLTFDGVLYGRWQR